ncbi:hypothetical protein GCM10027054_19340 [Isoptericola nanjingensis]
MAAGSSLATAQTATASARWSGCEFEHPWASWTVGGDTPAALDDEWSEIFRYAASAWDGPTTIDLEEAINFGPAMIVAEVMDYGDTDWSGRAPDFQNCDMLTFFHDRMQFIEMNSSEFSTASLTMKRSTAAHELGHVIGLAHPTDQTEDIWESGCENVMLMNHYWKPRQECSRTSPQTPEREAINQLYSNNVIPSAQTRNQLATPAPAPGSRPIVLDYTDSFDTLDEVSSEAKVSVVVKPTGASRVERIGNVSFTVTQARVTESIVGEVEPGEIIEIRQDGDISQYAVDAAELLKSDATYLTYLREWTAPGGAASDQYMIVGGQAAWRMDGEIGRLASGGSKLPATVTIADQAGDRAVRSAN